MTVPLYITCCAARKDPAAEPLPAAWRYRSSRIDAVLALAVEHAVGFRILSGKFGLVAAGEPIPPYDHLLAPAEVPAHAAQVAAQLRDVAPLRVVYFSRSDGDDPAALPYRICCEEACRQAGISCRVALLPAGPVDLAMLEMMG
ncbi:MAG: hypothetical protein R6X35_10150 [Candidatus Krumholzibacteriia bacterium]